MSKSYIENDKNIANSKNEMIYNYKTLDDKINQQARNEKPLKYNTEDKERSDNAKKSHNKSYSSVQEEHGIGDDKLSSTSRNSSSDESEKLEVHRFDFTPIPGEDDDPDLHNKCWEYWKLIQNVRSSKTNK
ncbi:hypothetical protein RR48_04765 [Papilio machaon]|uniref:Uncharacterized protein n=1 Tax=Papilio machaon TaxID=76193 RepID=A0A0N1PHW9_PAPMA|nr:hypothetical protein RR48_04765 [Papilio machaon]